MTRRQSGWAGWQRWVTWRHRRMFRCRFLQWWHAYWGRLRRRFFTTHAQAHKHPNDPLKSSTLPKHVVTLPFVSRSNQDAIVEKISWLTPAMLQLDFRLPEGRHFAFQAGQFLSLRVGTDADGAAILRSYSLASPPTAAMDTFSLLVKVMDNGVASNWFRALKLGDAVAFSGPLGYFVLDREHPGDVVFAVTSVGIAPVLPMLGELLARDSHRPVYLFWGNRKESDLFGTEELARLRERYSHFEYDLVLSQAEPSWSGSRGHIGAFLLEKFSTFQNPTFYLVGNGRMVREVKQVLVERGIDRKRQIRNEIFFE